MNSNRINSLPSGRADFKGTKGQKAISSQKNYYVGGTTFPGNYRLFFPNAKNFLEKNFFFLIARIVLPKESYKKYQITFQVKKSVKTIKELLNSGISKMTDFSFDKEISSSMDKIIEIEIGSLIEEIKKEPNIEKILSLKKELQIKFNTNVVKQSVQYYMRLQAEILSEEKNILRFQLKMFENADKALKFRPTQEMLEERKQTIKNQTSQDLEDARRTLKEASEKDTTSNVSKKIKATCEINWPS